jgi:hypothetical protein
MRTNARVALKPLVSEMLEHVASIYLGNGAITEFGKFRQIISDINCEGFVAIDVYKGWQPDIATA